MAPAAVSTAQPRARALITLDALEPLLEQLYAPDVLERASLGGGSSGAGARTPARTDILDARAHADRTLAMLAAELRAILGVGQDTYQVPAWLARCWECGQGTLRYHVVQEIVSCAVCLDEHGEPYRWPAGWLKDERGEAEGEPLTLVQRLKQRVSELETEVVNWRDRYYDLAEQAVHDQGAEQAG